MDETLGKRIMHHRKRLHLTQDQLAEKLGVTAQAVSKWENDQSCPDINMLPKLAALFGTSTDALLGHEPVYEAQVVDEDEKQSGWEFQWDNGRGRTVATALCILAVGMLLLCDRILGWNVGFWSICWPCVLLTFGIYRLCRRFNFTSIACTLLGGYFLLKNMNLINWNIDAELILPTLILIFGLCLLVDAAKKPKKPKFYIKKRGTNSKMKQDFDQNGEYFHAAVSFGEARHAITLPRLSDGKVSCSFGELTLDLTGCADFAPDCTIDVGCSFGKLNLLVPRTCRVQCDGGTSFGGIETVGAPDADCTRTIHLTGGVSFGEIEVRYV